MKWITGCGGPLLLLSEEWLEAWEGIDVPQDGRTIRLVDEEKRWLPGGPATDYDRACEIEEALANLEVGGGQGIVVGGEPDPVAHWEIDGRHYLVRWVEADSEEAVLRHLDAAVREAPDASAAWITAQPGPLVLFDAACPGKEIEDDCVRIELHPGHYVAGVTDYRPDDDTRLVLIELSPAG